MQGLVVRGHKEQNGNLIQLLKCRCDDVDGLKKWLERNDYLSHDTVNEIIKYMAHKFLRKVLSSVRNARWFGFIVDETMDISRVKQVIISLRWVSDEYSVWSFEPDSKEQFACSFRSGKV